MADKSLVSTQKEAQRKASIAHPNSLLKQKRLFYTTQFITSTKTDTWWIRIKFTLWMKTITCCNFKLAGLSKLKSLGLCIQYESKHQYHQK